MNEPKICPLCGAEFYGVPAISRTDNKTPICERCGYRQPLERVGLSKEKQEIIIDMMCRGYDPNYYYEEDES